MGTRIWRVWGREEARPPLPLPWLRPCETALTFKNLLPRYLQQIELWLLLYTNKEITGYLSFAIIIGIV